MSAPHFAEDSNLHAYGTNLLRMPTATRATARIIARTTALSIM
jgi:hypothetical protein